MLYCVTLYQAILGATTDSAHLTEHNIQLSVNVDQISASVSVSVSVPSVRK